jgi:DNA-binding LacI/PurR family transcriptional regulator
MAKAAVKALYKKLHGQSGHTGRIVISGHVVYRDSVRNLCAAETERLNA